MFRDDFDGGELDRSVWLPHYLPAWSSKEATKAVYRVHESNLELTIPPGHPLWCADEHPEPLRVSGVQSGSFSGPVGSAIGQQRFRDGLLVREEQERFEGWLPSSGRVAVRCRMSLSPRSMGAMWLAGFEEHPEDGGELCVVEVFGRSIDGGSAEIGVGVKQVNDPASRRTLSPRGSVSMSPSTTPIQWSGMGRGPRFLSMAGRCMSAPTLPPIRCK